MDSIEHGLAPGDRVTIPSHSHAFGDCFLVGEGTVLENRSVLSRERDELLISFDRGVTGIFKEDHLKILITG